jgi:hypothetical protein
VAIFVLGGMFYLKNIKILKEMFSLNILTMEWIELIETTKSVNFKVNVCQND